MKIVAVVNECFCSGECYKTVIEEVTAVVTSRVGGPKAQRIGRKRTGRGIVEFLVCMCMEPVGEPKPQP